MSIFVPAPPPASVIGGDQVWAPATVREHRATVAVSPALARRRRATGLTVVADVVAVASVVLVVGLTGGSLVTLAGFGLVWLGLLLATHSYDATPDLGLRHQAGGVLRSGAVLGLCCWIAPNLADVAASADSLILMTATLTGVALLARSAGAVWSARAVAAAGGVPLVVAGDAEDVARTVAELQRAGAGRWQVVAARVSEPPVGVDIDVPVTVGLDDLATAVVEARAEAALLLPSRHLDPLRLRRLTWQLEATGARLYVGTGLLDAAPGRTRMLTLGDLDLVHLRPTPVRSLSRLVKVAVDRVAVVLLLLFLAPLLAAIAIAIRLDSAGPALFRQRRVGRDGGDFSMFKFRTMTTGAENAVSELADLNEASGPVLFKIRQDPRVTRVGSILRRYSLDELPQLFNVLRGDMSLVGPRPALPTEVAAYDLDPRRRLAVLPGMTGLWQVSGRSDLSWDDTVRLDLHYVDNWSLGLDAAILCRTFRAVLGHRGAY